ncbi:hypothetical protein [Candidatus Methylacidiphilum infernorum]|uniref:Uncharacterized protein n=1 Tax=Methylacidiphilum infernorum (isolate V4) TaxID=481448 RepID=B3DV04_METI4|nr:hypothetical protein [Candidatus Methylacidiphilum infernorum]ACD83157.1 Hypothetical protein Minf_1102 [Methylacidiphilum infernorum V4]
MGPRFYLAVRKLSHTLISALLLLYFSLFCPKLLAAGSPQSKGGPRQRDDREYAADNIKELIKVQKLRSSAIQKRGICPPNLWVYGKFEAQDSPKDGLIICLIAGDRTKRIAGSSAMALGAGILFWPLIAAPAFFSSQHLDHVIFVNHTRFPPIKKNDLLYVSPSSPAKVLVNMKTDAGYHLMELELVSPPAVMPSD